MLVKMSMLLNCKETSLMEVFEDALYENRGLWGLQGLFGEIRWGDCNFITKVRNFGRTSRVSVRNLACLLFSFKVTRNCAIEWCITQAPVCEIRRVTSLRKHVLMNFAQNVKIAYRRNSSVSACRRSLQILCSLRRTTPTVLNMVLASASIAQLNIKVISWLELKAPNLTQ